MISVTIQGIKGSFHEQAALDYFGKDVSISSSSSFQELAHKVSRAEVDYGIIAIENTVAGTIHENLQLIRTNRLNIVGEIKLRIEQNLAAIPGASLLQLTEVHSHYMALNQCRGFLDRYPHIKRVATSDTASALKHVAQQGSTHLAAIGSKHGAAQYELQILQAGIETYKQNYTRFLVITSDLAVNPEFNKSTVILKLEHKKGALAELLSELDQYPINLSKIESFPVMGEPWHYSFILDLEYVDNANHEMALEIFRKKAKSYSVLGLYAAAAAPS